MQIAKSETVILLTPTPSLANAVDGVCMLLIIFCVTKNLDVPEHVTIIFCLNSYLSFKSGKLSPALEYYAACSSLVERKSMDFI